MSKWRPSLKPLKRWQPMAGLRPKTVGLRSNKQGTAADFIATEVAKNLVLVGKNPGVQWVWGYFSWPKPSFCLQRAVGWRVHGSSVFAKQLGQARISSWGPAEKDFLEVLKVKVQTSKGLQKVVSYSGFWWFFSGIQMFFFFQPLLIICFSGGFEESLLQKLFLARRPARCHRMTTAAASGTNVGFQSYQIESDGYPVPAQQVVSSGLLIGKRLPKTTCWRV